MSSLAGIRVVDTSTMVAGPPIADTARANLVAHDVPSSLPVPGAATKFSEVPAAVHLGPPSLGQHIDQVLGELADSQVDTDDLRRKEAIR